MTPNKEIFSDLQALEALPPLREIISAYNLRAEKKLGQNFLLDPNLTDKIARQATPFELDETIIEIGPGPGGLTRSLLRQGAPKVMAVEYDPRALAALESLQKACPQRLDLIHQDALTLDIRNTGRCSIVANLPYNIATPLLIGWARTYAEGFRDLRQMVVMVQREVAERLVATPGDKTYGRLSVIMGWLCQGRILFDVPPTAFVPPPKVMSSVVHLVPRTNLSDRDLKLFQKIERLTAAAFGQRRKMLRQSLKTYLPLLESIGIDPTLRAENLSIDDFIRLAQALPAQPE